MYENDEYINNLQNIILNDNNDFIDALFILQDFLSVNNILDYQINNILNIYSEKIKNISKYNNYDIDIIFLLLYSSIMLYNDLANPEVINKIKHNEFVKMLNNINNSQISCKFLSNIYNKIYDKINNENIKNNKLHNKKIITCEKSTKSCIIL